MSGSPWGQVIPLPCDPRQGEQIPTPRCSTGISARILAPWLLAGQVGSLSGPAHLALVSPETQGEQQRTLCASVGLWGW